MSPNRSSKLSNTILFYLNTIFPQLIVTTKAHQTSIFFLMDSSTNLASHVHIRVHIFCLQIILYIAHKHDYCNFCYTLYFYMVYLHDVYEAKNINIFIEDELLFPIEKKGCSPLNPVRLSFFMYWFQFLHKLR